MKKRKRVRRTAKLGKKKSVGYGWVGRWRTPEGGLGWNLPNHLGYGSGTPHRRPENPTGDDKLVFCEITVKAVADSRGRPIERRAK